MNYRNDKFDLFMINSTNSVNSEFVRNKLNYNAVLHNKNIIQKHLRVLGDYKFSITKYVDREILSTYDITTKQYHTVIEEYSYLLGNCVELKNGFDLKNSVELNDDCVFCILQFLDVIDIINWSMVSKRFYEITKKETLWKKLFDEKLFDERLCNIKYTNDYYDNCKLIYIELEKQFFQLMCKGNINIDYIDFNGKMLIERIPQQISQLKNLTVLHLYGNKILNIPISICKLSNLRILNLGYNRLKNIPSEIQQLNNLNALHICSNPQLKIIPIEVGNLKYLKELSIDNTQIKIIPPIIGKLKRLRILRLSREQFAHIPIEITKIRYLQYYFIPPRNHPL